MVILYYEIITFSRNFAVCQQRGFISANENFKTNVDALAFKAILWV